MAVEIGEKKITPAVNIDRNIVSQISKAVYEPDWLTDIRLKAWEHYNASAWPAADEEEWRRTSLGKVPFDEYTIDIAGSGSLASFSQVPELGNTDAFVLPLPLPDNLAVGEKERAYEILRTVLESAVEAIDNRFTAWNMSLVPSGALVYVPDGVKLSEPVLIQYSEPSDGGLSNSQVLVVLGDEASVSVVQRFKGGGEKNIWNNTVTAVAGDRSTLSFTTEQDVSDGSVFIQNTAFHGGIDSVVESNEVSIGGSLVKTRNQVYLRGSGAEARMNGLYFPGPDQHMDLRTVQYHQDHHGESKTLYKGAVSKGGRSIYQGLIDVDENAAGTDAYLTNKNLILGDGARADSIPCLEIRTNDVKCSHGSTSGRINEEEIFYLMSRGIPRKKAEIELVLGYFEEVIGRLPEIIRESVRKRIADKLTVLPGAE